MSELEERGTQCLIGDKAWGIPGIREKAEKMLRDELQRDGCQDITKEPPTYIFVEPVGDQQFEPHWAWAFNAVGVREKNEVNDGNTEETEVREVPSATS